MESCFFVWIIDARAIAEKDVQTSVIVVVKTMQGPTPMVSSRYFLEVGGGLMLKMDPQLLGYLLELRDAG